MVFSQSAENGGADAGATGGGFSLSLCEDNVYAVEVHGGKFVTVIGELPEKEVDDFFGGQ